MSVNWSLLPTSHGTCLNALLYGGTSYVNVSAYRFADKFGRKASFYLAWVWLVVVSDHLQQIYKHDERRANIPRAAFSLTLRRVQEFGYVKLTPVVKSCSNIKNILWQVLTSA